MKLDTIPLEMKRLILLPFVLQDADAVFQNWAADPEVTRFLSWKPHQTVAVTKAVIASWQKDYRGSGRCHWGIVRKETGGLIGNIAVVESGRDWAELGYCIGRACWGQGIVTEGARAVIDYLFSETALSSIRARHHPDNPASGAVMHKAGMRFIKIEPNGGRLNTGEPHDVALYSLDREEWAKGKEKAVWASFTSLL